jgi:hypothetical protein
MLDDIANAGLSLNLEKYAGPDRSLSTPGSKHVPYGVSA